MQSNSIRGKVWLYFVIFSVAILAGLWLFQVIFLSSYYEFKKTVEITKIGSQISKNYGTDEFEDSLDNMTFKSGVCIEIIDSDLVKYSTNSYTSGCVGEKNTVDSLSYKKDFVNSNVAKRKYTIINTKFKNKTLVYALKLDEDTYAFINVSLEPLGSTTNILVSQLIYVTIVILMLSFVIAYFVSKKISAPIIKIKNAANEMSKGNYDVVFETGDDITEINELADTLNKARDELSKTDELRRELLANVSHDLKTPLTMIKAYAEMVRDLTYDNPTKREENLNTIIDETERLNLLVGDILNLSKIQSNVESLKIESFDLNEMINAIISKFKYLSDTNNYKFEYKNKDSIIVEADKVKIEQVIYNLISNAVNYVGKDKKVIINTTILKDTVKVEIIDHGKGIDKEEMNLIWDKYYKVDKTHKRNVIGTGLGLSIVKNILIKHDAPYGVDSIKDEGTTFYFELPISKEN